MPEIIPLIIPILTGAAAATGIGTSIYSLTNQPGAPKPATPNPAQTAADAAKTKQNQEAALSQEFPGIQAATGGSLSPEAWARLAELISGRAGEPGIGSSAEDLIKRMFSGSSSTPYTVSAGNATPGSTTGSTGLTTGPAYG
jgi:hypothetical protein